MTVWSAAPVEERPEVELIRWRIFETCAGTRHFVGCETLGFCGRVSSAIMLFDVDTLRGVTTSRRVYQLSVGKAASILMPNTSGKDGVRSTRSNRPPK
jgi:hypothetical protein